MKRKLFLMPVSNQPSLIGGTMLVSISQQSKIGGSGAEFCGSERATSPTQKYP
jgi:hypothetical protein